MDEIHKHYQILGLNTEASEKEILEAYKVLVKVWNPDRFSDDPHIQKIATEKIREIDEAFKQLLIEVASHHERGRETTEPLGTRGSIVVKTDPIGAIVHFNGKPVGNSPIKGKNLSVGSYNIRVIKDGYEIWEQDVDIYAGAEKEVFAKLKLKESESGEVWKDPYLGMEFVYVKGGRFEMGDIFGDGYKNENPVHEVCVDGFWISKFVLTQGQWEKVMGYYPPYFKKGADYPVECFHWDDTQMFIDRLNEKTGMRYRLPTEAEWEYAARSGGKREKWSSTDSEEKLREYAWYGENSGDKPHPVGQKKPNVLGLHDMSGNVWEWVQDWYSSDYYNQSGVDLNPQGPKRGEEKVVRGGSCNLRAENIRLSFRKSFHPRILIRDENIGFRLVLPAQPEQTAIAKKEQPPASGEKPYGTPTPSRRDHHRPDKKEPESKASPIVSVDDSGRSVASERKIVPSGVGGWLLLLVIGMMVLGPLLGAGRIGSDINTVENQYPQLGSLDQWKTFKSATWWTFLGFVAISFYGGWGLARGKDWSVVTRAKAILWISGPVASIVMSVLIPIIILDEAGAENPQFIAALVGSVIAACIWTAYLSKSKRVRATYDRSA